MAEVDDVDALHLTTKLVDFLAEVTDAATRDPVRDILADEVSGPELVYGLTNCPRASG